MFHKDIVSLIWNEGYNEFKQGWGVTKIIN